MSGGQGPGGGTPMLTWYHAHIKNTGKGGGVNLSKKPSRHGKQNLRKIVVHFEILPGLGGQTGSSSCCNHRYVFFNFLRVFVITYVALIYIHVFLKIGGKSVKSCACGSDMEKHGFSLLVPCCCSVLASLKSPLESSDPMRMLT